MERKVNKRTFKIDEGRVRNGSAFHAPVTSDICYSRNKLKHFRICDIQTLSALESSES
jgi:hypothetical protein